MQSPRSPSPKNQETHSYLRINRSNLTSKHFHFHSFFLYEKSKMRKAKLNKAIDETHDVSRKILSRLIAKPMRQHEVCEKTIQDSVSIKKTITVFYWLRDQGFIHKIGKGYCSPYEPTEKGKLFYKVLTIDY